MIMMNIPKEKTAKITKPCWLELYIRNRKIKKNKIIHIYNETSI